MNVGDVVWMVVLFVLCWGWWHSMTRVAQKSDMNRREHVKRWAQSPLTSGERRRRRTCW